MIRSPAPADVVRRVFARVVAEDDRVLMAGRYIELSYTASDPYAVTLAELGARDGQLVFARDLLAQGLREGTAGEMAVRLKLVMPEQVMPAAAPVLLVTATWPGGGDRFALSPTPVGRFLARTYQVVPFGQEDQHLGNVEREIEAALRAA